MKQLSFATAGALLGLVLITDPSWAQGAPQTIAQIRVDVGQVATGYRASKIHGAAVYNDANVKIGAIDDLIVSRDDRVLYAVVSVGGFLGMGKHLVAVPYSALQMQPNKTILPGATKDQLKAMPEFKYART